ncbi:PREDICTED: uncharacterized protein LOC106923373 [Poecilia mexicana]|uniref:Ig-like domain-containing protein n=1 Tax=Poecilia mexicana TaxID=48701 RepID=A0A3B3XJR4_9TELE|nr:PREDICTED: uncharacterized protein LOC106923373 [Poecilia mexicana]
MYAAFFILLMLQVEYAENFVITTVAVGENVTFSCKRHSSWGVGSLFWIKLIPGKMPDILGSTFTFNYPESNTYSRISTKQEPGSFVLHLARTRLSDTAFYFCLRTQKHNLTFLNGTLLRIKESEPDVTVVTQDSLSDAVHEGDSVSLHCSVLSQLEKKTCPEERKVFWFRVSSPQSRPSLIYAQNEGDGKCGDDPESQFGQSCVFNFVKDNISSSDTGTYYCALAACGMVVFGNGTKLEFQDDSINNSQRNITLLLLCGILVLMLIATALLIYLIRKKCCHFSKDPEFPGRNAAVVCGQLQNQQRSEDSVVYSTAAFTQRNDDRVGRVKARRKEGTIYSDVRIFDKE